LPTSAIAQRYLECLRNYEGTLTKAIKVSQAAAGRKTEPRPWWATVLFTRLCTSSVSLMTLVPRSRFAARPLEHFDCSSVASLACNVVDTSLLFFYLCVDDIDENEWRFRLTLFQLHDCISRIQMFRNLEPGESLVGFEEQASALRETLASLPRFRALSDQQQEHWLKGERVLFLSQEQILERMKVEVVHQFLGIYQFLAAHAHSLPLAIYRMGERDQGKGVESDIEKGQISLALEVAEERMRRATEDMKALFPDITQGTSLSSGQAPDSNQEPSRRSSKALSMIISFEAAFNAASTVDNLEVAEIILCSSCFRDEGLRLDASHVGIEQGAPCPNCQSLIGRKLDRSRVENLARSFFIRGTIRRFAYGAAPDIVFNKHQKTGIAVAPWLEPDLRLIESALGVGFFNYGPRSWMFGEIEPLKALQEPMSRTEIVKRILATYPKVSLSPEQTFYRVRRDPKNAADPAEYDSPPPGVAGGGRLHSPTLPVLYGSRDLQVCIHECRVSAEDELFVATLDPVRTLTLLDLTELLQEEHCNEFTSLDLTVHMLFLAGKHSYEIAGAIAMAAREAGCDGLVYPSYFSLLRTGAMPFETTYGMSHRRIKELVAQEKSKIVPNIALFGRPVAEGNVTVRCINRVVMRSVEYNLSFGPAGT